MEDRPVAIDENENEWVPVLEGVNGEVILLFPRVLNLREDSADGRRCFASRGW